MKEFVSLREQLRKRLDECKITMTRLERESGVDRVIISRFLRFKQQMRSDMLDKCFKALHRYQQLIKIDRSFFNEYHESRRKPSYMKKLKGFQE